MTAFDSLTLPNGVVIPNRICKAAMEENMADAAQAPSPALHTLYRAWAKGGAGLILSGNVMIDGRAMTGPGGVVLEDESNLEKFRIWAKAGLSGGAQFWLQINHPGRQMRLSLGQETKAPSAVPLALGRASNMFGVPKEMTAADIADVVGRFARASRLAEKAGFTGVQIHAAHGYLISQFLSPISNRRTDQWGGSLENRARLLIETLRAVRAAVSPGFCVSVKLNSADFQRGGFSAAEALLVVRMLNALPIDLLEVSGGSYEAPAMQGDARDGHTLAREAYFIEFARAIAGIAKMPVMVTGGIRRLSAVEQVLDSGIAMAGIATALAISPGLPSDWKNGHSPHTSLRPVTWKAKSIAALARMAMVKYQLRRLAKGAAPSPNVSPLWALVLDQIRYSRRTKQYRHWIGHRGDTPNAGRLRFTGRMFDDRSCD
jgi:2,4-dienoyl-CoA reductase-like NADH-dependent reductase (Old Yellow Enzyme family)